jgi:hypothetical protein
MPLGSLSGRLKPGQDSPGSAIVGLKPQDRLEMRHRFIGSARGLEQRDGKV